MACCNPPPKGLQLKQASRVLPYACTNHHMPHWLMNFSKATGLLCISTSQPRSDTTTHFWTFVPPPARRDVKVLRLQKSSWSLATTLRPLLCLFKWCHRPVPQCHRPVWQRGGKRGPKGRTLWKVLRGHDKWVVRWGFCCVAPNRWRMGSEHHPEKS